jgi:hyperosmotically inducible protein
MKVMKRSLAIGIFLVRQFSVLLCFATVALLSAAPAMAIANTNPDNVSSRSLPTEVRHQLLTLPYYGVFDWLDADIVADNTVILRGAVRLPGTKADAEARMHKIEGVSHVVNEIEVLPLSPNDERLRVQLYRAIFKFNSPLFQYSLQAVPPIHIIVKNGQVTLKGIVLSTMDRQLAYVAANGVPGVFSVQNELLTEQRP